MFFFLLVSYVLNKFQLFTEKGYFRGFIFYFTHKEQVVQQIWYVQYIFVCIWIFWPFIASNDLHVSYIISF